MLSVATKMHMRLFLNYQLERCKIDQKYLGKYISLAIDMLLAGTIRWKSSGQLAIHLVEYCGNTLFVFVLGGVLRLLPPSRSRSASR